MKSQPATQAVGQGTAGDYVDRVNRLAQAIGDGADQGERDRRLTDEVMAALHGAGLFRMLLPKPYGGAEVDPAAFSRTIEAVARLDASTAWCICQGNGCAMTAAYLEPEVADAIWGQEPNAVVAWGPGQATGVREGNGYRVTGKWSFASGGRHATWFGGHSVVKDADGNVERLADGSAVVRTMLFPASDAPMTEIWDVIGLRGTGSDAFAVTDLFVRHDHSVMRDDPSERRYQAPLYLFPAMCLYAAGFSGTALGIARSMLDAFKELASEKKPRLARQVLRDDELTQFEVARSEVRLGAARTFLLSELDDIWAAVVASGELRVEQRMRIRLASTHAIHEAKEVADTVYDLAGASTIFANSPFERRFRDIHTVTQQLQGRKAHMRTVGAFMLGHPPDMSVV